MKYLRFGGNFFVGCLVLEWYGEGCRVRVGEGFYKFFKVVEFDCGGSEVSVFRGSG